MELSWGDDCFVCGKDNPEGLRLEFHLDEAARTMETVWVPRATHQGYADIVHGGLVAAVLDEVLGKLTVSLGIPAVTAELSVRFQKPVPPARPLKVRGRLTGERGRLLQGESEAFLEDGTVAAAASAKLMRGKS